MPDAFIPVVKTPIFEFVPYKAQLVSQAPPEDSFTNRVARQCEQHLLSRSFDLSKMTHAQLREPPVGVSEFLRDDVSLKQQRWSLTSEADKKEIVFFLL